MESETKCYACAFWKIEPDALDQPHSQIARERAGKDARPISSMYGKCSVDYFVDKSGEVIPLASGTLGGTNCNVYDSLGNLFFKPVPED